MGLLRVSMAQGDPGRFRLPSRIRRGISIRNLRAGIRGLAPFAQFIPGAGFISTAAQFAGDQGKGVKGGTHAHPVKHGTSHPHAKPSHAHARAKSPHKGGGGGGILGKLGSAAGRIGIEQEILKHLPGGQIGMDMTGLGHPPHELGMHRRRMNFMNIKAARRAGRRVAGALRLLTSLKKSLPHVGHKGTIVRHKKRSR